MVWTIVIIKLFKLLTSIDEQRKVLLRTKIKFLTKQREGNKKFIREMFVGYSERDKNLQDWPFRSAESISLAHFIFRCWRGEIFDDTPACSANEKRTSNKKQRVSRQWFFSRSTFAYSTISVLLTHFHQSMFNLTVRRFIRDS